MVRIHTPLKSFKPALSIVPVHLGLHTFKISEVTPKGFTALQRAHDLVNYTIIQSPALLSPLSV